MPGSLAFLQWASIPEGLGGVVEHISYHMQRPGIKPLVPTCTEEVSQVVK